MKVILKTEVSHLGRPGEVKQVARGYARNYLLPRGLAAEASPRNLVWWEKEKGRFETKQKQVLEKAKKDAEKIQELRLSFSRSVSAEGKLFGSVGKTDILKSLKASGLDLDKSAVLLDQPLKTVGDFEIGVQLHPEVQARIRVSVVSRAS